MRIFVTAGNTQVPIDRVRCITNVFTGRTGAAIALEAYRRGHHVTIATSHPKAIEELRGDRPLDAQRWQREPYQTYDDLEAVMRRRIAETPPDAVVHCAAVSDYRVAGVFAPARATLFDVGDSSWRAGTGARPAMVDRAAGKVKSDEAELWLRLTRTPKLVDRIRRDWEFAGILVKFKLEVDLLESELIALAEYSRQHSAADLMVANTLEGVHSWALVGSARGYRKVTRTDLPAAVVDAVESQHREARHG